MSVQNPIAQFVNVINNAQRVNKKSIKLQYSKIKLDLCKILKEEGYIESFNVIKDGKKSYLAVFLKYFNGEAAIKMFKVVSKPSCRIYSAVKDIEPVMNGLGVMILTTPRGVMTLSNALKEGVGGELLCEIF
jgi:small subunit ribosomal protein S8